MSDPYVHKNLTKDDIQRALTIASRLKGPGDIPLNTRMLEKVFSSAEEFDSQPAESRKGLFITLGIQPAAAATPAAASSGMDGLFGALNKTRTEYEKSKEAPKEAPKEAAPTDLFGALNQTKKEYAEQAIKAGLSKKQSDMGALGPASVPQVDASGKVIDTASTAGRNVGKVKDMVEAGPMTQFGRSAASLFDVTLGSIAPGIIEPVTYAGARAAGKSPTQAKEISTGAAKPFEQPLGRTLGITETPEYKGEVGRRITDFIGENFQKGAAWIAEKTGMPVQDVENMMGTMVAGGGIKAAPAIQRGALKAAEKIEGAIPGQTIPTTQPTPAKPKITYAEFQEQLNAKRGAIGLPPAPPVKTATMPAPTTQTPFPEIRYAPKGAVNLSEQDARKAVLSRIGLPEARESSILGDGIAASNEFQTSKASAPIGYFYKDVLDNERAALENFGQQIIRRTGGTIGLDENSLYNRGNAIVKPFDDFKNVLETQMSQAYDQAKQIAAGQPIVNPTNLQNFLNTNSNFVVNQNFIDLRNGIKTHLKEADLLTKDGRIKPMTVDQAENLRKYINGNWSNERSNLIGRIKDKIDNDVTKVAGEDVYKNARDIRTKIRTLFDDPKGVAKIMDYDPKAPMNRSVAIEKIAKTVETMSVDQQRHLIKLLKEMPDEVRPQADRAIAEIKGHLANRILEEGSKNKGQWNAKNVTDYLNDNNKKLGILMEDPEIAQMVKDLHDAGHILKYDPAYPGAAIQTSNLIKLGVIGSLGTVGTGIGAGIGGLFGGQTGAFYGGGAGGTAGTAVGVKAMEKSALRAGKKKMVPLRDVGKGK
jgi:hypothetical protein